jgi:hypothetical protein
MVRRKRVLLCISLISQNKMGVIYETHETAPKASYHSCIKVLFVLPFPTFDKMGNNFHRFSLPFSKIRDV